MELVIVALLLVPLIAANGVATRLVLRDEVISQSQRVTQVFMVWLLPVIGAVLVFSVHRRPEAPSRKYREAPDPGDDFAFTSRGTRSTHHADTDE